MNLPKTAESTVDLSKAFFGQPRGLATLFFTEFWERFSYYGMRALLVLFMTASLAKGGMGYDAQKAGAIYGIYTSMVYLAALPGGWLADRLLGQRKAVLYGGIIIAIGHFCLAIESEKTFFLGLVFIVLGTGLLKPNMSVMVGGLYPEGGARRDGGFSIFYMGVNLGAFVAPFVCGTLGETVNWHLGFGCAGVGMILGLAQYVLDNKYLGEVGQTAPAVSAQTLQAQWVLGIGSGVIGLVVLLVLTGLLALDVKVLAAGAGVVIVALALLYFGFLLVAGGLNQLERKRVLAVAALFIFSALFWSGFEQAGSSLNLFASQYTERMIGSLEVPASILQAVNPLFIIGLAPVFAWLWVALGRREPSIPGKFALGLVISALGFLTMTLAANLTAGGTTKVNMLWLVLAYFFLTVGELCLSPVGLSAMTKLAPVKFSSQIMGVWFISVSLGNLIAGQVGGLFEKLPLPQIFGAVTVITLAAGIVLALLVKPLKGLMGDVR